MVLKAGGRSADDFMPLNRNKMLHILLGGLGVGKAF
jgi:hypothetical protein